MVMAKITYGRLYNYIDSKTKAGQPRYSTRSYVVCRGHIYTVAVEVTTITMLE